MMIHSLQNEVFLLGDAATYHPVCLVEASPPKKGDQSIYAAINFPSEVQGHWKTVTAVFQVLLLPWS